MPMTSITIRNLDASLKSRLKVRAAVHGRSMEDEARSILRAALSLERNRAGNLAQAIRARVAGLGGVDLEFPAREAMRAPPDLSE